MSDRSETCSPNPSLSYQNSLERNFSQSDKERPIIVKKMDPTPTADLDRTHDLVYDCTTNVVKAVMSLSQGKTEKIRRDQTENKRKSFFFQACKRAEPTIIWIWSDRWVFSCVACYLRSTIFWIFSPEAHTDKFNSLTKY